MMFEVKPIAREAIPEALQKVERYRLLNEPSLAESICEDILRIEPHNQHALAMLLLTLTDQIGTGGSAAHARAILPRFEQEYDRAYYAGIIAERTARAMLHRGIPGATFDAYQNFREAMEWYERAESLRHPGNDDAILRWNTCARILNRDQNLRPRPEESFEPVLGE
jgi:hypothetical protein